MKKIFSLLSMMFLTGTLYCQINMDTVYTRNNSLQAKDWNYFLGYFESYQKDSTDRKLLKRIAIANYNKSNSTIVVIDSLPGKWGIKMVELLLATSGGEYRKVDGDAVITMLKSKAQLLAKINDMEVPYDNRYKAFRDAGVEYGKPFNQ